MCDWGLLGDGLVNGRTVVTSLVSVLGVWGCGPLSRSYLEIWGRLLLGESLVDVDLLIAFCENTK